MAEPLILPTKPVPIRKISSSDFVLINTILGEVSTNVDDIVELVRSITVNNNCISSLCSGWHTKLGFQQTNKIINRINDVNNCINTIIKDCADIVSNANLKVSEEDENLLTWKNEEYNYINLYNNTNGDDEPDYGYGTIDFYYNNNLINDELSLGTTLETTNLTAIDEINSELEFEDDEEYYVHEYVEAIIIDIFDFFSRMKTPIENIREITSDTSFWSEINSFFEDIYASANKAYDILETIIRYLPGIIASALDVDNAIYKALGDEVWNNDTDISNVVDEETYIKYEKYMNEEEERENDIISFYNEFCSDGTIPKNFQYQDLKERYALTDEEINLYLEKVEEDRNKTIAYIVAGRSSPDIQEKKLKYNITEDDIQAYLKSQGENTNNDNNAAGEETREDDDIHSPTSGGNPGTTEPNQPSAVKPEETQPETPPEENPGTTEPEIPTEEDPGITEPETPPEEDPGTTEPEIPPEEDPGTTEPETPPEEDPGTTEPETPPEEDPGTTEPEIGGESDWSAVTDEEGNIPEPEVTTGEDTFTPPEETGDTTITEPNADGSEPILDQNGDVQQPEIDDTVSDEGDIVSPAPEEGEPVVSENDDVQMPKVGDTGAIEDDMVNPTLDEPNISEDKLVSPLLDDENAVISDATSDIAESTTDALNEATADADVAELNSNVLENDPSMENMMSSNDKDSSFDLELDNVDPLDVNPIEDDFDFNAMMEGIDDKIGFSRLDIPKPDGSIPVPKDPTIKDM